jgi:hypothetical protein
MPVLYSQIDRNIFATDAYVCANCAYLELYVADEETLQKLLENEAWERVG